MNTDTLNPPPNDPFREAPEPAELKEALPCPKCGCTPDWDKSFVGGLKVLCCGIESGWWSTWEKATAVWDQRVDEYSGDNRKAAGIAEVSQHNGAWIDEVVAIIEGFADGGLEFTIEHVRLKCRDLSIHAPAHPNCWGAAMNAAARHGLIEPCGYTTNKLPSAHARVVRQWRGKR